MNDRPDRVVARTPIGGAARTVVLAVAAAWVVAAGLRLLRHSVGRAAVRRFEYYAAPLADRDYGALAHPPWRTVGLDVGGDVTLRGLERAATDPGAPVILYFAGNSSSLLADAQRFLDALVASQDWRTVVWAYRGFDGSPGRPDPRTLAADGWRAYQALTDADPTVATRIHIIGFSLGTSIATAVAARASGAVAEGAQTVRADGHGPASLTLIAPLTTIEVRRGWLAAADRYDTLSSVDAIAAPALVVHGDADDQLPIDGGRRIASRLGARARFVAIPGAGHLSVLRDGTALETIRAFITEHARR